MKFSIIIYINKNKNILVKLFKYIKNIKNLNILIINICLNENKLNFLTKLIKNYKKIKLININDKYIFGIVLGIKISKNEIKIILDGDVEVNIINFKKYIYLINNYGINFNVISSSNYISNLKRINYLTKNFLKTIFFKNPLICDNSRIFLFYKKFFESSHFIKEDYLIKFYLNYKIKFCKINTCNFIITS